MVKNLPEEEALETVESCKGSFSLLGSDHIKSQAKFSCKYYLVKEVLNVWDGRKFKEPDF